MNPSTIFWGQKLSPTNENITNIPVIGTAIRTICTRLKPYLYVVFLSVSVSVSVFACQLCLCVCDRVWLYSSNSTAAVQKQKKRFTIRQVHLQSCALKMGWQQPASLLRGPTCYLFSWLYSRPRPLVIRQIFTCEAEERRSESVWRISKL